MNRPGAQALTDEVTRGQDALDALPSLMKEARHLQAQTAASMHVLQGIRRARPFGASVFAMEFSDLRRAFLRQVAPARHRLRRRIGWLSLRKFWRVNRFWIGNFILSFCIMMAVVWMVRNWDWLAEQIQTRLPPPTPPAQTPAPVPAPTAAPSANPAPTTQPAIAPPPVPSANPAPLAPLPAPPPASSANPALTPPLAPLRGVR